MVIFINYVHPAITMAKRSGDFILRDRMQITLNAAGETDTLYGRLDLSDFTNAIDKKGLAVKELYIQVRDPMNVSLTSTNTGIWNPAAGLHAVATPGAASIEYKLVATTRAYESLRDVGIGSPDVLYCKEALYTFGSVAAGSGWVNVEVREFPTRDLHPEGYTLVSDLLIGIAIDEHTSSDERWFDGVIELDIMMIAESVSVTQKMLTNLLTQAQDV